MFMTLPTLFTSTFARFYIGGLSAAGLSALSSMLGFTKRKNVQRQETIEGQVRVSTVKKDGPDFGDLKVSQCLQVRMFLLSL